MTLTAKKRIILIIAVIIAAAAIIAAFIIPSEIEKVFCAAFILIGLDEGLAMILLRCPKCKKPVSIFGMRFCPYCGEDLVDEE